MSQRKRAEKMVEACTFYLEDILEEFPSLDMEEIRDFCRGNLEQALNCRWGEDNDPQLVQWNKFKAEGFKELP